MKRALATLLVICVFVCDAHADCPVGERALPQGCVRAPESAITIQSGILPPSAAPRARRTSRARTMTPAPIVTVETFVLDAHEVTWTDYMTCVVAGACAPVGLYGVPRMSESLRSYSAMLGVIEGRPIRGVTLADARAYCGHVGGRVPFASEWELAARGTTGRTYPWGEAAPDRARASYGAAMDRDFVFDPGVVGTHPLGDTPEGVHDLAGSVREWVIDTTVAEGYGIIRGGSFLDAEPALLEGLSSAIVPANLHAIDVGFRCAYGPVTPAAP